MATPHFQTLRVKRVTPQAGGAIAVTLAIPPERLVAFAFKPGQFLTLRAHIDGTEQRRSYSICSSTQTLEQDHEIEVGIKPVPGGLFSNWAARALRADKTLDVMPPDGRFCPHPDDTAHRVGIAAGSGITPILSIMASTLQAQPLSRFTLVYGNQRVDSILFGERLQDLKDRYPTRVSLIHVLSRQAQEIELLNGRIDAAKLSALLDSLIPADSIDEVFICGPEGMIAATEATLHAVGLDPRRIHTERFASAGQASRPPANPVTTAPTPHQAAIALDVVVDGKTHGLRMNPQDKLLDVALAAGLDLPYSCRAGVCCTCRGKIIRGEVAMEKNFTLEQWEIDKGFVLTCQARPLSPSVVVSYDER